MVASMDQRCMRPSMAFGIGVISQYSETCATRFLPHTCLICYELLSNSKITGGVRGDTETQSFFFSLLRAQSPALVFLVVAAALQECFAHLHPLALYARTSVRASAGEGRRLKQSCKTLRIT